MAALAISVVIPTHDRATLVTRAINSALAAIEPGDEIIVVDDGSTDSTAEVVAAYGDRLRYLPLPHGGAGRARNRGIAAARNPLIAFLDSDDEWMPDKLRLQRAVLTACPEVAFCFSDFAVRREAGAETRHYLINWHHDRRGWHQILGPGCLFSSLAPLPPGRSDFLVHRGDLYAQMLRADYVPTTTVMVRRTAVGAALHFAEDLSYCEDGECFARLAQAGVAAYLDCETAWQWGHRGPRLTQAPGYLQATCRLIVMERVWGADPRFLATHGGQYRAALALQHRHRAWALLKAGRSREARAELRLAGHAPWPYRALAALPRWCFPLTVARAVRAGQQHLRHYRQRATHV